MQLAVPTTGRQQRSLGINHARQLLNTVEQKVATLDGIEVHSILGIGSASAGNRHGRLAAVTVLSTCKVVLRKLRARTAVHNAPHRLNHACDFINLCADATGTDEARQLSIQERRGHIKCSSHAVQRHRLVRLQELRGADGAAQQLR